MNRNRQEKGITLIALVITIIVLLILAAVAINLTLGENGIFNRAKEAKKKYGEAQLEEELELQMSSLIVDAKSQGRDVTINDIANKMDEIGEVLGIEDDTVEGEYKDHSFTVDKDGNVTIGKKLTGAKPTAEITILTEGTGLEKVEMQVVASTEEGEIASIEPVNGAVLKTENSVSDKIYEVTNNGVYKFKITGTNGRVAIARKAVNSLVLEMEAESILEGIARVNTNGLVKMKVKGKTTSEAEEEEITYRLNVINKGSLVLNAEEDDEQIADLKEEGITVDKTNKIYSFGATKDIGTASTYAQNTVVLKVNGNLTINEGVTATALGSAYGGPKGLIIYCTGTVTNNGTISMSARGAKAVGENVYLLKNSEGSFEYIPAYGGGGAGGASGKPIPDRDGGAGGNGTGRQLGGGGAGALRNTMNDWMYGAAGSGATATSYSGGSGGGSKVYYGSAGSAGSNGGPGGAANSMRGSYGAGGGAGNPGGGGSQGGGSGGNGTGGLLVIYSENLINENGTIVSNGSNGGYRWIYWRRSIWRRIHKCILHEPSQVYFSYQLQILRRFWRWKWSRWKPEAQELLL